MCATVQALPGALVSPSTGRETEACGMLKHRGFSLGSVTARIWPQGPVACGLPGCWRGGLNQVHSLGPGPASALSIILPPQLSPALCDRRPTPSQADSSGCRGYGEPQGLPGGGRGGSLSGSAPGAPAHSVKTIHIGFPSTSGLGSEAQPSFSS